MDKRSADVDVLALERQLCFAVVTASRSIVSMYRPILEPLGLTHPQYLVMLALWERDPRTLRDIAEALLLEPPTLTPLLKRLEASGHLQRERSATDGRELRVALTPAGRDLRAAAEHVPGQVLRQIGMPLRRLEELRAAAAELGAAARKSTTTDEAAAD